MSPTRPVVGFDLDMTLVDSAAGITKTFCSAVALASGGRVTLQPDDVWPYIGMPLEHTAQALAPTVDEAQIVTHYRALYPHTGVPLTRIMPGALDALKAVRAAQGRILVISAKRQVAVEQVLEQVGLGHGDLAPDMVAGNLFAAAKGHALMAESAHVYAGDHPADVEAARTGGCAAVCVATGPASAQELAEAGADVVLPDLYAFDEWLGQWLARGSAPAHG